LHTLRSASDLHDVAWFTTTKNVITALSLIMHMNIHCVLDGFLSSPACEARKSAESQLLNSPRLPQELEKNACRDESTISVTS